MAGKVVLGALSRHKYFPSVQYSNLWGNFTYRSYHTAEKVTEVSQKKVNQNDLNYDIHNSQVPTYEQVKNSPELQEELEKMYEAYAQDPDFNRLTIESMKVGIRSLGKEND